ncbi:hypothetical protein KGO04_01530 [Patescibacteria group bacterium]|nr:hypothetical protein [Patescibacteria group bacterium]MDE1945255.1 hypothetical protein [Patescibacteria group bacterium]
MKIEEIRAACITAGFGEEEVADSIRYTLTETPDGASMTTGDRLDLVPVTTDELGAVLARAAQVGFAEAWTELVETRIYGSLEAADAAKHQAAADVAAYEAAVANGTHVPFGGYHINRPAERGRLEDLGHLGGHRD